LGDGKDKFGLSLSKYFWLWNKSIAIGTTNQGEFIIIKLITSVAGVELFDFWYTPISVKK